MQEARTGSFQWFSKASVAPHLFCTIRPSTSLAILVNTRRASSSMTPGVFSNSLLGGLRVYQELEWAVETITLYKRFVSDQKTIGLPVATLASASSITSFVNSRINRSLVKPCNFRVSLINCGTSRAAICARRYKPRVQAATGSRSANCPQGTHEDGPPEQCSQGASQSSSLSESASYGTT